MKTVKTIAKFLALALVLITSVLGYFYFSAWQKNERPTELSAVWSNDTATLGETITLRTTIRTAWHRRPDSTVPTRLPDGLVAPLSGGIITKGTLDLTGHREWTLEIPIVPTATELGASQLLEIPLNSTRRRSVGTAAIALPALTVVRPENIPADPLNNAKVLRPDSVFPETADLIQEATPFPWMIIVAASVAIAIVVLAIRHLSKPKPAPHPWDTAREALDRLAKNPPEEPSIYYLQLTDILKHYTTERFTISGDSASASELLRALAALPEIDPAHRQPISEVIRTADAVKFAQTPADEESRTSALSRIRAFVESTTPKQEEANA